MNSSAASGGSAQPVHDAAKSELTLRVMSGLVLAPVTLGAIVLGSPFVEAFLIVSGLLMAWEWDRICNEQQFGAGGYAAIAAIFLAGLAGWLRRYDLAALALFAGTVTGYVAARMRHGGPPGWVAASALVVGVPCLAAIWLRAEPEFGLRNMIWLIGMVWATDLGGYVVGRLVGGPKLAPRVSPGKTWSGLGGAVGAAGIWGLLWAHGVGAPAPWASCLLAAFGAVVAQVGDLGVSSVKRRFGVKDASNLIPGHGGVLDRFDGLLTAAPLLALLLIAQGGGMLWG